jgi:hypothetical protein
MYFTKVKLRDYKIPTNIEDLERRSELKIKVRSSSRYIYIYILSKEEMLGLVGHVQLFLSCRMAFQFLNLNIKEQNIQLFCFGLPFWKYFLWAVVCCC